MPMPQKKKVHSSQKTQLHQRNKHRNRYNFKALIKSCPELERFVSVNKYGDESIDFFNPKAVKTLNKALLLHFYKIKSWDIPDNYLCPPIPGRADYIHYAADLLSSQKIISGANIKCLDIGTGANCIYPIIGHREYGWSFVGTDIDSMSIKSAKNNINATPALKDRIEIRRQVNSNSIFKGIIKENEQFELTICNPPFHSSAKEARDIALKKQRNLKKGSTKKSTLNFGGQSNELWCKGGEEAFIKNMILESKEFSHSCLWFTTLVSKQTNLKSAYHHLKQVKATDVKTITMEQGNKVSRLIAWTFLNKREQKSWQLKWNS